MSQKSRLMHECPNCGWVGKAPEHAFTPAGYKRCPKCKEIGIDIGTHMLPIETFAWPPSPAPLAYSSEPPRVAGRYWMQCKAAPQYETVWNVTEADVANPPSWFRLNRFAGPLERPMEAR